MRKLLVLSLFVALMAMSASAQETPIDKGSMIVGGTAVFQSLSGDLYENAEGDSYTMIAVMPAFGYFISPGLVIGGELMFVSETQGDNDASGFGIGPMVGYYFNTNKERAEIKGAIYPYIKGFLMYESISMNDADATQMSFGGGAGINFMLSDAVAVDFGVRIASDSFEPDGGDSVSGMNMQVGAGIAAFVF